MIIRSLEHTSILARFCLGISDDLCSYLVKVKELLARKMQEFSPFVLVCATLYSKSRIKLA